MKSHNATTLASSRSTRGSAPRTCDKRHVSRRSATVSRHTSAASARTRMKMPAGSVIKLPVRRGTSVSSGARNRFGPEVRRRK